MSRFSETLMNNSLQKEGCGGVYTQNRGGEACGLRLTVTLNAGAER